MTIVGNHIARTTLAIAAVSLPALLAFSLPPSVTFLNQAAALAGWGALLALLVMEMPKGDWLPRGLSGLYALVSALLLMAAAAVGSWTWMGQPSSLAVSSVGMLGAATLVLVVGAAVQRSGWGERAFRAFCFALALAGLLSLAVALVQYFAPQWADGQLIARLATPGRAGANLRQPNHLSSLLLWSVVALVWLHEVSVERREGGASLWARGLTLLLLSGLLLGVVLTVSRTGGVCVVMLALWGVLDKSLSRFSRRMLWAAPFIYIACWKGVAAWAEAGAHAFAGQSQLHGSDPSSSRFGIWSNTLELIKLHPWSGVGWGEFNFSWSLSAFPGRPGAFFDHTHNLPLNLLVELGLPLGGLALALIAWALWKALQACVMASPEEATTARAAGVMVSMMVVHSMLEYPLWYAYFLLPAVFAFGICLGHSRAAARDTEGGTAPRLRPILLVASMTVTGGAVFAVFDYLRVVDIFAPSSNAAPLGTRIAIGQRSWFFAHHADYAAATSAEDPTAVMDAFDSAPHYLLDTRLMMTWARALHETGDNERARYLAQRLKEFKNPASAEFFAECDRPVVEGEALPFQCMPPTRSFGYEVFRAR